jgi:hypothetical protein
MQPLQNTSFVSAPFERLEKIHQQENADFICYQCYKSVLTRRGLWSLKLFWWRSASSELILKLFNKAKCYSITLESDTLGNIFLLVKFKKTDWADFLMELIEIACQDLANILKIFCINLTCFRKGRRRRSWIRCSLFLLAQTRYSL